MVGIFGFLLALGSNTPLEHLFNSVPLYGHQRLQSRNLITVATAICVLFAGWIDRTDAGAQRAHDPMKRWDRITALLPFGVAAALAIWAAAAPASVLHVFAGVPANAYVVGTVREATVFAVVFTAVAAALVWIRPRLGTVPWARLAAVFVAVDLGLMGITSQLSRPPPNDLVSGTTPVQQLTAAHLAPGGRMVNYDPQAYASYPWSPQGVPDLNIVPKLPSVSGYASIVNGSYESATHTHEQYNLDIGQLASGTLDRLDLREVVTVPEYFLVPLASMPRSIGDVHQLSENYGSDPALFRGYGANFNATAYPFYPGPRPPLRTGQTSAWFFGESLELNSATLVLAQGARPGTLVRLGALSADGSTHWGSTLPVRTGATSVTGRLPTGAAVGLSVQVIGSLPAQRAVITAGGRPYELGGSLSSVLVPGQWQQAGFSEGYAVFTLRTPPAPISASTTAGRPLRIVVVSSSTKSEEIRVDAPSASTLVRSVAWDSGWSATVSVNGEKGREHPGRLLRPRPARPHPGRERSGDLPLPTTALPRGERPQPRCQRALGGAVDRVARTAPPASERATIAGTARGDGERRRGAAARRLGGHDREGGPVNRSGAPGRAGILPPPPPTFPRARNRLGTVRSRPARA